MAPKRRSSAAASASPESKKGKTGLAVGEVFPDLGALETEESTEKDKKTVDLKEILQDKGVILFFYPKANTPGCTTQACGFRDNYATITAAGYEVFGMSADKPKPQSNWKVKHGFPYHLLCDPSFEALSKLGVTKGAKSVSRSHIIIDKGGKVASVEYGISPKDSIAKAAEFVAKAAGAASKGDGTAEAGEVKDAEEAKDAEEVKNADETKADEEVKDTEEAKAEPAEADDSGLKVSVTVDETTQTVSLQITGSE